MAKPSVEIPITLDKSALANQLAELKKGFQRSATEINSYFGLANTALRVGRTFIQPFVDAMEAASKKTDETVKALNQSYTQGAERARAIGQQFSTYTSELSAATKELQVQVGNWLTQSDTVRAVIGTLTALLDDITGRGGGDRRASDEGLTVEEAQARAEVRRERERVKGINDARRKTEAEEQSLRDRLKAQEKAARKQHTLEDLQEQEEAYRKRVAAAEAYQRRAIANDAEFARDVKQARDQAVHEEYEAEKQRQERLLELQQEYQDAQRERARQEETLARERNRAQVDAANENVIAQEQMLTDIQNMVRDSTNALIAEGIGVAIAESIAGGDALGALRSLAGGIITTLGQMLLQMGTAAVIAGTLGTIVPFLAPATGGTAGVGAGLAAMAGGAALIAVGSAISGGGGGGGASSAPTVGVTQAVAGPSGVPAFATSFSSGGGEGGGRTYNIYLGHAAVVGSSPAEAGRQIQSYLDAAHRRGY